MGIASEKPGYVKSGLNAGYPLHGQPAAAQNRDLTVEIRQTTVNPVTGSDVSYSVTVRNIGLSPADQDMLVLLVFPAMWNPPDTGLPRASEHLSAVVIELREMEMSVGIKQHGKNSTTRLQRGVKGPIGRYEVGRSVQVFSRRAEVNRCDVRDAVVQGGLHFRPVVSSSSSAPDSFFV